MKRLAALLLPFLLANCKETPAPDLGRNCSTVSEIAAAAGCYEKSKGLRLTATNLPKNSKMLWVIAPLPDTVSNTYKPVTFETDSSTLVIPDSIVANNQVIGVVFAGTLDCVSEFYFSFVRRYNPATQCDAWYQKDKFVMGD